MNALCLQICLIMDEVDGMSGGDRGGVADLIQSIHRSKVPIICICNDKYNQKLRSLRNHTLELDYRCVFVCVCMCACDFFVCSQEQLHRLLCQCALITGVRLLFLETRQTPSTML